jgi:acetyl-CoA acetyltransferase
MAYEDSAAKALVTRFDDVYLLAGARTPFADYMGVLRDANPIDLAIHVVRSLFQRSGVPAAEVQAVIAGNMAQAGLRRLLPAAPHRPVRRRAADRAGAAGQPHLRHRLRDHRPGRAT